MRLPTLHRACCLRARLQRLVGTLVACLAGVVASALGQVRADDLTRLVPAGAGLVMQFDQLAERMEKFQAGPLGARLRRFPPVKGWLEKQSPQLQAIAEHVQAQLQAAPEELWKHVLGRQVVLAAWPPENGQAGEPGPGLVLVECDSQNRLLKLRDAVTQLASGGARNWRDVDFRGQTCRELTIADAEQSQTFYVAVVGRVGVLTNDRALMEQVLSLAAARERTDGVQSIAGQTTFTACKEGLRADAAVWVFVNPRVWDAALADDVAAAPPAERAEKQLFYEFWRSLEYAGASLEVGDRLFVQGLLRWRPGSMPPAVAETLASFGGPAQTLRHVPRETILAYAGRIDAPRLLHAARQVVPEAERRNGAWILMERILRLFGPDVMAYALPDANAAERTSPATTDSAGQAPSASLPLSWTLSVRVRPHQEGENLPPAEELVQMLLPLGIQATGLFGVQGTVPLVRTVVSDKLRVQVIENWWLLPKQATAAYAIAAGYIWTADTARQVERAAAVAPEASLAESMHFRELLGTALCGQASQALYVDLAGWRVLVAQHKQAFATAAAESRGVPPERAERGLEQLLGLLDLADTAVAALRIEDEQLAFSLGVAARP